MFIGNLIGCYLEIKVFGSLRKSPGCPRKGLVKSRQVASCVASPCALHHLAMQFDPGGSLVWPCPVGSLLDRAQHDASASSLFDLHLGPPGTSQDTEVEESESSLFDLDLGPPSSRGAKHDVPPSDANN